MCESRVRHYFRAIVQVTFILLPNLRPLNPSTPWSRFNEHLLWLDFLTVKSQFQGSVINHYLTTSAITIMYSTSNNDAHLNSHHAQIWREKTAPHTIGIRNHPSITTPSITVTMCIAITKYISNDMTDKWREASDSAFKPKFNCHIN